MGTEGAARQRLPIRTARRIAFVPTTGLGRWAVCLAVASFTLVLAWRLIGPVGALPGFACGLAGGVVALLAIFRGGERAISVFAAIVPLAYAGRVALALPIALLPIWPAVAFRPGDALRSA
jgi:hypothetical protein